MARFRRGAAAWAALIDEWKQSGLSQIKFCQERGISRATMQGWIYKPARKQSIEALQRRGATNSAKASPMVGLAEPTPKPSTAFVPVRFAKSSSKSQPPTDHAAIEVILDGGRRVAVGPGFDEETLRKVVTALESKPC